MSERDWVGLFIGVFIGFILALLVVSLVGARSVDVLADCQESNVVKIEGAYYLCSFEEAKGLRK